MDSDHLCAGCDDRLLINGVKAAWGIAVIASQGLTNAHTSCEGLKEVSLIVILILSLTPCRPRPSRLTAGRSGLFRPCGDFSSALVLSS